MFVGSSTCSNINTGVAIVAATIGLITAGLAIPMGITHGFTTHCYVLISMSAGSFAVGAGAAYFARRFRPLKRFTYTSASDALSTGTLTKLNGVVTGQLP